MEVEAAALCLCRMKHQELDTKTSNKLQNLIRITESQIFPETRPVPTRRMFPETRPVAPRRMFPASCPLPRPQINRKENKYNIGNGNGSENKIENKVKSGNRNESEVFSASCPIPRPQINRRENKNNIGNGNENINGNRNENTILNVNRNQNQVENGNQNESEVFKPKPEFIQNLTQGVISLTRLPPLGQAIDRIVVPRLPPIEALQGKIVTCTMPFEKQLTKSDLSKSLARLMFCKDSVEGILKKFMNEREYNKVISTDGLEVIVYDQAGRAYKTKFILWSKKYHVLSRGWTELCSKNNLQSNLDWVTVWMFWHREVARLCFAIVARRFPTPYLIDKKQKNGNKNKKQKREE